MSTVLVVDDDPVSRNRLCETFAGSLCFKQCAAASSETEALDSASRLLPVLVIWRTQRSDLTILYFVPNQKKLIPTVAVFLLKEKYPSALEKQALCQGITAVFSKSDDSAKILVNAEMVCSAQFG